MGIHVFDSQRFKNDTPTETQYQRQLNRLAAQGKQVDCIESAVTGAASNLSEASPSFVIYGEPQSGKTEMMICLTAKLLDIGRPFILHLLNDSVDLLGQNLGRFQASGLAPAAKNFNEVIDPAFTIKGRQHVVFCKKNPRDLARLLEKIGHIHKIVVIDDEADFASPNGKVNKGTRTKINNLILDILGKSGDYIGVTATPARLDLNNTFDNDSSMWVDFPTHRNYTGQDVFFPLERTRPLSYRLTLLPAHHDEPKYARTAFFRFLVSVAFLNTCPGRSEKNFSMLIHTSGKKVDHKEDQKVFERTIEQLITRDSKQFESYAKSIWEIAANLYGNENANALTKYVLTNISRYAIFVLNSDRDFNQNGQSATNPSALFTIIIGGNIVSRGVTFENLLAMFFTRDVKHKIQQDTYIQRARMFGSRGEYLPHFELTIPENLFEDWHRCFVFHRLALSAIHRKLGAPVWLTDHRISAVSGASIDRSTVDIDRGEMAFRLFEFNHQYDQIVSSGEPVIQKLERLAANMSNGVFPPYLKEFIVRTSPDPEQQIALHPSASIAGYTSDDVDKEKIERRRGFMGRSQLERNRYPDAIHHIKVFWNAEGKARLYYKFEGSIQFMKNSKR